MSIGWAWPLGACFLAAQHLPAHTHGIPARVPAASSYERYVHATPASDAERALRAVTRAFGHRYGHTLRYDWRLGHAAQALMPWAQTHSGQPLPIELLREAAWREGWTDGELAAVAITSRSQALPMALALQLEHGLGGAEASHMGLALHHEPGDGLRPEISTAVVALSRRLICLAPVARTRAPGSTLSLVGRVASAQITAVTLATESTQGAVDRRVLPLHQGHFAEHVPVGTAPGTLQVELLIERGRGPEVAASFPIAVGHRPVGPVMEHPEPAHGQSLLALVWGLRASRDLALPAPLPGLMQAAWAHAQDMRANHFFAHVSPVSGDVTQRLKKAHVSYAHVVENIALGADADDAFAQWLQSPGHLQNLLDPRVTHVGVALLQAQDLGNQNGQAHKTPSAAPDPQSSGGVLAVLVMASLQ